MARRLPWIAPVALAAAVVLLVPLAQHGLAEVGQRRPLPRVGCVGRADAPLRIVYLHGRDSYGPSWIEIKNRETLRALARDLGARIALPRVRGGWPQHDTAALDRLNTAVQDAAQACFEDGADFGILGFSDGGDAASQLYLRCRSSAPRWVVAVGSQATLPRTPAGSRAECGPIALVAGRHESTYPVTRGFAQQLRAREATVRFLEHSGVHELPFAATRDALLWASGR